MWNATSWDNTHIKKIFLKAVFYQGKCSKTEKCSEQKELVHIKNVLKL